MAFTSNCQRQLIIWHNHRGGASVGRIIVQEDLCNASWAKCFGDKVFRVFVPLNDINFFVAQFAHDALNPNTAHTDASTHWINTGLHRLYCDL